MHLEIRTQNKKKKYYLAHSLREGRKVHKLRKFLGIDLNTKLLEERKKIAEKLMLDEIKRYNLIKDPLHVVLSKEDLDVIKKLQTKIPIRIKHLSEDDWIHFTEIFTYNTNAIEGSELTDKEVKEIIERDIWPDKSKDDIAEAYGVQEAIAYIRKTKEHLSIKLIKDAHKIVFKNSKHFAGKLRRIGEEVVIRDGFGNIVHEGAPQTRIIFLLNELIDWYNKNRRKYPALLLAAVVHNQFENIHPFADGNGRVGRILLNNILLKQGFPPINIELSNRMQYYTSLQAYEKNHDLHPTLELFIKEYKALEKSFR
ncbi:Fic family protein [Candidatus Woesearchaeota archaeon]|nr:Fic family protein [Candidatus Woesearchaeota archaeon]